jgi:methionyl-tRNA synthetase
LDEIWQRVRRLNRYVEEEAPWNLAKDTAQEGRLDEVLYSLAEGLRVVTILLHPYIPASATRLLDALRWPEAELPKIADAEFGERPGGYDVEMLPPLFPKVEAPDRAVAP